MEVHHIYYKVNKHNLRSERQRFRRGELEVKMCVRRRRGKWARAVGFLTSVLTELQDGSQDG